MTTWADGDLYGFDLETTGVDVFTDRIVTACVVRVTAGKVAATREWLVNPGVPIPDGARDVHGITTEHAQAHGMAPVAALEEIADTVAWPLRMRPQVPLVVFNSPFDISMLEAECRRHGIPTVTDRVGDPDLVGVVDAIVLAKEIDRVNNAFRKGRKYKLVDLCERYKVPLDDAHNAAADATAACGLLRALVKAEPHLAKYGPKAIHVLQRTAYREDQRRFRQWLTANQRADEAPGVHGEWPLRLQEVTA